ncbi:MAG: hypothetical protein AAF251_12530 [Pseudomonadota bacterium]
MDYSSVWAIWAVAIAGPCVISWLAGDIAGSARTRQLYGEKYLATDADAKERQAYRAGVVEEWRVPGVVHPLAETLERADPATLRAPSFTEEAASAERRRLHRAAVAAPSQASGTRSDEQEPDLILRQYARSISDLRTKPRLEADHADDSHPVGVEIVDEREVRATRPA